MVINTHVVPKACPTLCVDWPSITLHRNMTSTLQYIRNRNCNAFMIHCLPKSSETIQCWISNVGVIYNIRKTNKQACEQSLTCMRKINLYIKNLIISIKVAVQFYNIYFWHWPQFTRLAHRSAKQLRQNRYQWKDN